MFSNPILQKQLSTLIKNNPTVQSILKSKLNSLYVSKERNDFSLVGILFDASRFITSNNTDVYFCLRYNNDKVLFSKFSPTGYLQKEMKKEDVDTFIYFYWRVVRDANRNVISEVPTKLLDMLPKYQGQITLGAYPKRGMWGIEKDETDPNNIKYIMLNDHGDKGSWDDTTKDFVFWP